MSTRRCSVCRCARHTKRTCGDARTLATVLALFPALSREPRWRRLRALRQARWALERRRAAA